MAIRAMLPAFFKPILWSDDFELVNPERHAEVIIVQALNYGDLCHWRWIVRRYGLQRVREVISKRPVGEFRAHLLPLLRVMFHIETFNHVSRGTHS